jgi:hypothetical protein
MCRSSVFVLIPVLLVGCAATNKGRLNQGSEREHRGYAQLAPEAVKKKAAFDFGCTQTNIAVTSVGGEKWGAAGCSERHLYAVSCHNRKVQDPADLRVSDCDAILMGPLSLAH